MEEEILLSGLKIMLKYAKENLKTLSIVGALYGSGMCAVSKYLYIKQKLTSSECNEIINFIKLTLFRCKSVEPNEIHKFNVRNGRVFMEEAGLWLFLPHDWQSRINWLEEQINKLETNN